MRTAQLLMEMANGMIFPVLDIQKDLFVKLVSVLMFQNVIVVAKRYIVLDVAKNHILIGCEKA